MLLQFAVENFRSIADKVVLSFLAVEGEEHPEGQVVHVPGVGGVLRSLVIYGPNAAGKSSLLAAFSVLRQMASDGVSPGAESPVEPHRLRSTTREAPTRFEIEVFVGGVHYAYGLVASPNRIQAEWLTVVDGPRDRSVFQRDGSGGITFGEGLDVDARRREFYAFVAEGTRPEQPLLAEFRARNATEFEPLLAFLSNAQVEEADTEWSPRRLTHVFLMMPDLRRFCADVLREAGTGVTDIVIVTDRPDIAARLGEPFPGGEAAELARTPGSVRVGFVHRGPDGHTEVLVHGELSDGTRRLLWLADLAMLPSKCTFVDELDRSLHTQLAKFLLRRLHLSDPSNQFVFTTHDTNLLDAGLFGRDAIWFCEKDSGGATHLYSLVEFDKAQLDQLTGKLEEGYLQGRFGALPFASDPVKLGWAKR